MGFITEKRELKCKIGHETYQKLAKTTDFSQKFPEFSLILFYHIIIFRTYTYV